MKDKILIYSLITIAVILISGGFIGLQFQINQLKQPVIREILPVVEVTPVASVSATPIFKPVKPATKSGEFREAPSGIKTPLNPISAK